MKDYLVSRCQFPGCDRTPLSYLLGAYFCAEHRLRVWDRVKREGEALMCRIMAESIDAVATEGAGTVPPVAEGAEHGRDD